MRASCVRTMYEGGARGRGGGAARPGRQPVLLPPPESASRPLPGWLTAVALVGLAVLFCVTVPAVLRRVRLARDLDRLREQVTRQEHELRRLEQELRAAKGDTFAYEQALRRLLHPPAVAGDSGARSAASPGGSDPRTVR